MSVRRQLKNVVNNYSNAEVKVREATSNDPWGPSSSVMTEIADATYNVVAFSEIMGMIWKRLNDHGKNWRHVYKSLVVLDYIIKTGTERVAQQCRENLYAIQTLKDFQFIDKDGKDQGMNVREKAKQLVALLKDEDRLKSERARALKAKERFAQASSGIGSDSVKAGNLRDSGSTSDLRLGAPAAPATGVPTSRSWEPARKVLGSDMETCRPSNANEEELQLQLALALSKQEAEEKEKLNERDDQRLQMAISQSQQIPSPQEPLPLDVGSNGVQVSQDTFDPWGSTPSGVASSPMSQPSISQPSIPQPDPWLGGTNSVATAPTNPWGDNSASYQLPINSSQNLFGASNNTPVVAAMAGGTDPWGAAPIQSNSATAPPLSDPWSGRDIFPGCASSFSGFILRRNVRQLSPLIFRQDAFHQTHEVPLHAKYGGRNTVTLIPGDGVGPEMVTAVKDIFRYIGAPVDFEELNLSGLNLSDEDTFSDTLEDVVTSVKRNGAAIKGNIFTPLDQPTFKSLNVELRLQLDLFANVVRCKSIPGIPVRHGDVDLVIIRENTEGEYSHIEHENVDGVIESFKVMTEEKCTKVAKYAFDFAVKHGRKKVTAVHKANIMKLGDGLFLRCCEEVSKSYPDIEFNSMIIDNCCMQLVSNPEQFDVMVMPNLYGNIVSNIGASLVGGPGIVPGENIGGDYAVFESGSRHTGLDIKGKNVSNPMSLLFASTLMLEHLGWNAYGDMIHSAILRVVQKGVKTADIGGGHLTTDFLDCLKEEIGQIGNLSGAD